MIRDMSVLLTKTSLTVEEVKKRKRLQGSGETAPKDIDGFLKVDYFRSTGTQTGAM